MVFRVDIAISEEIGFQDREIGFVMIFRFGHESAIWRFFVFCFIFFDMGVPNSKTRGKVFSAAEFCIFDAEIEFHAKF